jgi:hypothetical protein
MEDEPMTIQSNHLGYLSFFFLAACSTSNPGPDGASDGSLSSEAAPFAVPSLDSGLDPAAFAAALAPVAVEFFGRFDASAADTIKVGRPWGQFDVHKGPRLVFRGTWRVLVAIGGEYATIATVARDGDSFKIVGSGSTQFIPTLVAQEQLPAVSAALDRGRAGLLRRVGDGGDALAAYETDTVADGGPATIMVQPLGSRIIDGGVLGELSLDELNATLPAE